MYEPHPRGNTDSNKLEAMMESFQQPSGSLDQWCGITNCRRVCQEIHMEIKQKDINKEAENDHKDHFVDMDDFDTSFD